MLNVLHILRWKNLVLLGFIIFLTNLILQRLFSIQLPIVQQVSLVITALSICGAGNLINDLFDKKIDSINKPHKLFVQNFSNATLFVLYGFLNLLGLVGTYVLVVYSKNNALFFVNISVIILLFIYSKYLKTSFLMGNILISLLAGYSYLFPMLIYRSAFSNISPEMYRSVLFILGFYTFFSVLMTFIREVAKDGEDIVGDFMYDSQTLVIKIGLQRTIKLLKLFMVLSAISIFLWGFFLYLLEGKFVFLVFIIVILYQLKQMYFLPSNATSIKYLHKINIQTKFIFISAILSMFAWL